MIILAIDTCGKEGSLALVRATEQAFEVLEQVSLAGRTYSAQVVPQLAAALERQKLAKSAIDLYAIASGPGSFTGIRVGIATVKALAEVFGKPLVEVSVLEAMAYSARTCSNDSVSPVPANGTATRGMSGGRVVAALDAQRAEVYVGEYELEAELPKLGREVLLSQAEFIALVRGAEARVVTSDQSVASVLSQAGVVSELIVRPTAATVAEIAAHKLREGVTVAPELLDANYIRRSDAEIFSAPKLGINTDRS